MVSKIPIYIKKYVWLIGQFIQNVLLKKEGIIKPEIEQLKKQFPNLQLGDLINRRRDLFGVNFDWDNFICKVRYKGIEYDITKTVIEIVREHTNDDWINSIGFDTRGIDINAACRAATKKIINKIIENGIM
ncbi:MAG: hypothetical protein ACTSYZ_11120 [Candidatus Helarchaeota archaeon]